MYKMNADIKVEVGENDDAQPDLSTGENILEFEEEPVAFLKPERRDPVESDSEDHEQDIEEMKEVKVLLTEIVKFTCVVCDRDLVRSEPIIVCKHNDEIVAFCNDCIKAIGKIIICVKCNHGFDSRRELIDHVNKVHRKLKKYKCEECDSAFTRNDGLKKHVQSVHRELKHACQQCNKTFSIRGNLSTHVNFIHRRLNIFTCDLCNKEFPSNSYLKKHVDGIHRQIRKFKCEECKRAYFTRSYLTKHINSVHRKLKSVECDKCDCKFAMMANLWRHTNTVHFKIKYTCEECNKDFTRKEGLISHINVTHQKIKAFVCTKCKREFGYKSNFQKHTTSAKCLSIGEAPTLLCLKSNNAISSK